jgi:hypothetical protein
MARPSRPAILRRRRSIARPGQPAAAPFRPDHLAARRPDEAADRSTAAARPSRIGKR